LELYYDWSSPFYKIKVYEWNILSHSYCFSFL
jgi:hypothetical protein